ncbi:hypothetical protein HYT92_02850 [Candidatus Pacearchaeota archaeon]|nr:hypothetical protein [Candidatus Pacearchaeota archaeon]
MATQIEGVRVEGLLLKEFLKDDFINELDTSLKDLEVVALIMMKKDGVNNGFPIVINHQNSKEVQDKLLHLECPNSETLNKIIKIIEKRLPKK